jgi:hypothetical protein
MEFEIKTGTDAIRAHAYSHCRRHHPGGLARDANVPIQKLEAFAYGKGELSHDELNGLARELLYARLDPQTNLLHSLYPKPKTMPPPLAQPPFPPKDPRWLPFLWKPPSSRPSTPEEIRAATAWRRRPGWAET